MIQPAHVDVHDAREGVRRAADRLGIDSIYTGFALHPRASVRFLDGEAPLFAPLVKLCLDDRINGGLLRVLTQVASPLMRARKIDNHPVDLYPGDAGAKLETLANRFLALEAMLWGMARDDGGYSKPVPYPVRYVAASHLWSPTIAGIAFCLRCGDEIRYRRAGRMTNNRPRTAPVCDPCVRSGTSSWPSHALMPYDRGRWLLRCAQPGCSEPPFPGRAQARYCPEHRQNRLTPSERRQ
jgi:hypothetical protein